MLDAAAQPKFGITNWFARELVGQDDRVDEEMTAVPSRTHDFDGSVRGGNRY